MHFIVDEHVIYHLNNSDDICCFFDVYVLHVCSVGLIVSIDLVCLLHDLAHVAKHKLPFPMGEKLLCLRTLALHAD